MLSLVQVVPSKQFVISKQPKEGMNPRVSKAKLQGR